MPIARFQMPDGRVARFEVPDGYSPEQALGEFETWAATQSPTEEPAYKNLAKVPKELLGFLEAPLAVGTGIVSSALGGWKGLGKWASGQGLDAATKAIEETQGYQPQTGVGQAIVKGIAAPFELATEKAGEFGQYVGGDVGETIGKIAVPAAATIAGYRPMVRGANAAATAAKSAADVAGTRLQRGGINLQLSALKPTTKEYLSGDAMFAAEDLIKRGITPNIKGIAELERQIGALNDEIAAKIGGSKAVIEKQKVLNKLEEVRDRFIQTVNPESDLATIGRVGGEFQAHPLAGEQIPVQLAQKMKQSTYRELKGKYGELGSAEVESQKALARGLKEGVAEAIPEIAALNAEESALLKTLNVAERRAFMELNKDPVPMSGALRSPEAWAAITADKSVGFKSLLARQLYKLGRVLKSKEQPTAIPPAPTSNLPVSYVSRGTVNPPEGPNWVPGRGFGPDITPQAPPTAGMLGFTPSENLGVGRGGASFGGAEQNINLRRRTADIGARQAEAEAAAAEASAPRQPASGGMLFDLDPITGKLRPVDQGLKGATPYVIEDAGKDLVSAMAKLRGEGVQAPRTTEQFSRVKVGTNPDGSPKYTVKKTGEATVYGEQSTKGFDLTINEKIALNKYRQRGMEEADAIIKNIKEEIPEFKTLSDDAIKGRIADRQWAAEAVDKFRKEYADWAKRSSDLRQAFSKMPTRMSEADIRIQRAKIVEANRKAEVARVQAELLEEARSKIAELEALQDALSGNRAGTRPFVGQGPKTRAANRGMLFGEE